MIKSQSSRRQEDFFLQWSGAVVGWTSKEGRMPGANTNGQRHSSLRQSFMCQKCRNLAGTSGSHLVQPFLQSWCSFVECPEFCLLIHAPSRSWHHAAAAAAQPRTGHTKRRSVMLRQYLSNPQVVWSDRASCSNKCLSHTLW